ncbi:MAG: DUF2807 domain-containing protein [Saprospiraceae bacterium]|nr:DUF2807 domain-containing protein [Saprospiraceae bacterium]
MKTSNKFLLVLLGTGVFVMISSMIYMRFFGIDIGEKIIGSGITKHEVRHLSDFSSVEIHGSFTTTIKQGEENLVEIDADENILEHITTELTDDNVLHIAYKDGFSFQIGSDIRILVQSPQWREIGLHGSGEVRSESQINGTTLDIQSNGSGDINLDLLYDVVNADMSGSPDLRLSGSANSFVVQTNGSGDIYADQFICNRVNLFISGSGDARVFADSILNVQVNGSGDVTYSGNAGIVNSKMYGSGELNKR